MIKVIHSLINTDIYLKPQILNVLVIENSKMLVSYIESLNLALTSKSEYISIVEKNQLLKDTSKICFITDIFDLEFNNKKIQNILLKKIYLELIHYEYSLNQIFNKAINLMEQAISVFDSQIRINQDIDINLFLKCFAPLIENEYDSVLEKIVNYINILIEFVNLKCIIFLNLQSFLTKQEIEQLFEHCKYKEVSLFLIENIHKNRFENEKCIIIDEDLCEIIV